MKYFTLYIWLFLLLSACSSDDDPQFPSPDNETTEAVEVNMKSFTISMPVSGDSASFFKGVNNTSRAPIVSDLYLIADFDVDQSLSKVIRLRAFNIVTNSDGLLDGDVRLNISQGANGDIYLSGDDGKSILVSKKVGNNYQCSECALFSTKDMMAHMNEAGAVTPTKKDPTCRPYGDRLFRSENFTFKYERIIPTWSIVLPAYDGYCIRFKKGKKTYFPATKKSMSGKQLDFEDLVFNLQRCTAGIQVNFCITDWQNTSSPDLYPLRENYFVDQMGTASNDWSVRTILTNVTTSFNLATDLEPINLKTGDGVLSVSDNFETFSECKVLRKDANPKSLNLVGRIECIGMMHDGDEGEVFILPMKNEESYLFFTINCANTSVSWDTGIWPNKKHHSAEYYERRTLRVPLSDLGVVTFDPNNRYELLVCVSLQDFNNAMNKSGSFKPKPPTPTTMSRGISYVSYDQNFGEVVELPYKVVVRKIEGHNTEKTCLN